MAPTTPAIAVGFQEAWEIAADCRGEISCRDFFGWALGWGGRVLTNAAARGLAVAADDKIMFYKNMLPMKRLRCFP